MSHQRVVHLIFRALLKQWGPQGWWPGRTRMEIIVGAILTQNTQWSNVEKAIRVLRRHRCLTPSALEKVPEKQLAEWIRSSGYYTVKARRLKAFIHFLKERYGGRLSHMARIDTPTLRDELLSINGIGPETADSILLYAFSRLTFVVDAYTLRFLRRHGLIPPDEGYESVRRFFEKNLPEKVLLYNEYHALIVRLGKEFCRPRPLCEACPLSRLPGLPPPSWEFEVKKRRKSKTLE